MQDEDIIEGRDDAEGKTWKGEIMEEENVINGRDNAEGRALQKGEDDANEDYRMEG